jgi:hypothetical protein
MPIRSTWENAEENIKPNEHGDFPSVEIDGYKKEPADGKTQILSKEEMEAAAEQNKKAA